MVNDKIGNTVFSIIFEICKKHNRANVDSIHKHIHKLLISKIYPKSFYNIPKYLLFIINKINSRPIHIM